MRKRFFMVFCSMMLVLGLGCSALAENAGRPVLQDVTGKQWKESTQNEKLAFLYGASSIIAIEHLIAQKQGQQASPFVGAWMKAFKDLSWMDLQTKLDAWYAAHPDQSNRQVFDVLWYEFMAPATGK